MGFRTGVIRGFSLASSLAEDKGAALLGLHPDVAPALKAYLERFEQAAPADRHRLLRQIGGLLRPHLDEVQVRRQPLRVRAILGASKRAPTLPEPQPSWRPGYAVSPRLVDRLRRIGIFDAPSDCTAEELAKGASLIRLLAHHSPQTLTEHARWSRVRVEAGVVAELSPVEAHRIFRLANLILPTTQADPLRVLGAVTLGFEQHPPTDPTSSTWRRAGQELHSLVEAQWLE